MDDFMVHINGGAIGFQCQFHDIHRTHHARAESTRTDTQQDLGLRLCFHFLPVSLNSQNTIISKTLSRCMRSATEALSLAGGPGDGCSLALTCESWRVYQFSNSRRSRKTRRVPQVRFGNLGLGVSDAFWVEALLRRRRVARTLNGK